VRRIVPVLGLAAFVVLAGCGSPPPAISDASPTIAVGITLPPAWTDTPTPSPAPPTETPTPTLRPAVAAARQTATTWPPIEIVAVGAGADTATWERVDFGSGSFLLPDGFEVADLRGVDDVIVLFLQAFANDMVSFTPEVATPAPGTPTSTPIPLDELQSAFDIDVLVAADRRAQTVMSLVGAPLPPGFDLEAILTEAVGRVQGEVQVIGREIVGGAPRPTARAFLLVGDPDSGQIEDQAIYVALEGSRAWTLSFQAGDFAEMEPIFETIALSLQPSP